MLDFVKSQFDKLLTLTALLLTAGLVLYLLHFGGSETLLSWASGSFTTALGALIGMLTGRAFQRKEDENGSLPKK